MTLYGAFARPRVQQLLEACALDISYERADGDRLFYRDARGHEVEVLDCLGGFGASLFGHYHPELVAVARAALDAGRPFHAQASVREAAGMLASRLSERVGRTSGAEYVVTLSNSGAEAVETAIKHAALVFARRAQSEAERVRSGIAAVRSRLREGTASLAPDELARAAAALGQPGAPIAVLLDEIQRRADAVLGRGPRFIALEGSFHGKTTGALQLTHHPEFREWWADVGLRDVVFLPPNDVDAFDAARRATWQTYPAVDCTAAGAIAFSERGHCGLAAFFVEPIQGEGGIHEIDSDYLRAVRRAADEDRFALVFDEIQCGMGRVGTFLASEQAGVAGDCYLISKSLGGGLAKIAACLVDRRVYDEEFGRLHTSTFAEDDFSCAIAVRALDLLDRDDGALLRRCARAGDRLRGGLEALHREYPDVIAAVRGRGLMLGVALAPLDQSASPLLRAVSDQHLLAYLVSGYLARRHAVRVAPTLSSHATIRLEPSAYIADADIDRCLAALADVARVLHEADAAALVAPIVDEAPRPVSVPVRPRTTRATVPARAATTRVGFLVHFVEPHDLAVWDPRLDAFTEAAQDRFLDKMCGVIEPFVLDQSIMHSAAGGTIELVTIAVPFTPQQAISSLRDGSTWATDLVKAAADIARRAGCQVLGLGGYTSIVTDNGRDLDDEHIVVTTGNGLTAAAALEALWLSAARLRIPLETARLGVLGAAGNIGGALAEFAAEQVPELVLVGRPGSARLLEPVIDAIYAATLRRLRDGHQDGLAAVLATTHAGQAALGESQIDVAAGTRLRLALQHELGDRAPIRISYEVESLRRCNLVLSATNAPRPVVMPWHISEGAAVVCDVAVPQDVHPSVVRDRPRAAVLRGGVIRAPGDQQLRFVGNQLRRGEMYACVAEAALLGFVGGRPLSSRGRLFAATVRQLRHLARVHGFEIVERPADAAAADVQPAAL